MSIIGDGIVLGAGGESASIFVTGLSETDTVTATNGSKTKTGVWTQIPNPAYVVPDGYTQLEYIESAGTQYIDTGYKPKTTTTIKTRFYSVPYTYYDCPFGCRTTSTSKAFLLFTRQNGTAKSCFNHGNSENWIATDNMYNKWLDVSTDSSHLYMRENNNLLYTLTFNGTAQDTEYNLFLFNLNEKGSIYSGNACATKCKMSYFQAYENDTLVRNLIPCERNSDSAIGMYDLVTNEFFGNSGTGTFTAGPVISQTIDGFMIDKIKSYGTWTVTATNGTKNATQNVLVDSAIEYSVKMEYKLSLYREGDECEDVTGGWIGSGSSPISGWTYVAPTINNSDITLSPNNAATAPYMSIVQTANMIDLTPYSALKALLDYTCVSTNGMDAFAVGVSASPPVWDGPNEAKILYPNTADLEMTVDITAINEEMYVYAHAIRQAKAVIKKVWLE